MSKELSLVFEDGIALQTGPDLAQLFIDGDIVALGLDDLGKMSEWLAVAWENLTGSPYEHHEIGVPVDDNEFAALIGNSESAIRKRAAVLPLFGDKIGVSEQDTPEFVDTVERLERDCE